MSGKLLPCPFCGHEAPEFERMGDRRQSCIVICGWCGARHESSDEGDRCGSSWNQRAEPSQDGLRTSLETALARIEDMLADDDGQAFKEARKFLDANRPLAATTSAPQQAEGWVMVPVEPTPEMLACILEPIKWAGGKDAYSAMLAARPSAPTAVEPTGEDSTVVEPRDEDRYQLLRRGQHWSVIDGVGDVLRGDDLDVAIDSILAARASKGTI